MSEWITHLYYKVTAYIPRQLPTTTDEIEDLQWILVKYFGLENDPAVWMNVMGDITSTPRTTTRKSLALLANVGKRVIINKAAHDFQVLEHNKLMDKLKKKVAETSEAIRREDESNGRDVSSGALDMEGHVPGVQVITS